MKSVWSFWSKPFQANRSGWKSELHHLLSWVLSVQTARNHYPSTTLVTDNEGAKMLVDAVGLEFAQVSTELNELRNHNPDWWAFGKLIAYSLQDEPFVHIDSDVILWEPLPRRLESAGVFAQNPEAFEYEHSFYRPESLEHAVRKVNGWIPEELESYVPLGGIHRGISCGILGGQRTDFLSYYARRAIELMDHPLNRPVWPLVRDATALSLVFEQYLLAACIDYHRSREDSPFREISVAYLFDSFEDAYARGDEVGFTHLLGSGAKQDPDLLEKLKRRVEMHYPALYERCLRYCKS